MLVKAELIKAPGLNLIVVNINKGCEILVAPPKVVTSSDDTLLDVSFGVLFKKVGFPIDEDYTPVAYSVRLGGKAILIDATIDIYHKKFSRKPVVFKITLPTGCRLTIRPQ